MKKIGVLLFSISLISLSLYGLSNNSYYVQIFIDLSTPLIYARLALIAILLAYTFVPSLRLYVTKALLGIGGILLLSLGLIGFGSPTVLGYGSGYMLIGDSLTLIEGGILAVVLSAELSARKSRFMARSFIYIRSLFASQPRKLTYSPSLLSANLLKQESHIMPLLSADRALPIFERLLATRIALNKLPP